MRIVVPREVDDLRVYNYAVPQYVCKEIIAEFEKGRRFGEVVSGQVSAEGVEGYRSDDFLVAEDLHMVDLKRWDLRRRELHGIYLMPVLRDYVSRYKFVDGKRSQLHSDSCIVSRYEAGKGHFAPHKDAIPNMGVERSLTVILYLNSVYKGGETEFFNQEFNVRPRTGSVLIFPSNFVYGHTGHPPISNDKYITVSFASVAIGRTDDWDKAEKDIK